MLTVKYGPTRRPINPCIPIYKKGPVWGFVDLYIWINSAIKKEKKLKFIEICFLYFRSLASYGRAELSVGT